MVEFRQIKLRRDSASNWTSKNPILADGELGIEKGGIPRIKIGNGTTAWNSLPYYDTGEGGGGGGAVSSVAGRTGAVTLTVDDLTDAATVGKAVVRASTAAAAKLAVGLSNVDNTSDNLKPISAATQTALDGKASSSALADNVSATATAQGDIDAFKGTKGQPSGLATLDSGGKVPSTQLPSYVDDILEYDELVDFPATGETGKIYIDKSNGWAYRWGTSSYVRIVASPGSTDALAEGSTNLYFTDSRAQSANASALAGKVPTTRSVAGKPLSSDVTLVKGDVGLGNVDNTSDAEKPVSTATQTALDGKANTSHSHAISDITGLQTALDGKQDVGVEILVLGAGDPVPEGTPVGTIIVRTA